MSFCFPFQHSLLGASWGHDWHWSEFFGTSDVCSWHCYSQILHWNICILTDSVLWHFLWFALWFRWMTFQMSGTSLGIYQRTRFSQINTFLQLRKLQVRYHLRPFNIILAPLRRFRSLLRCGVLQRSYPHHLNSLSQVAKLQRMICLHFIGSMRGFIVHHHIKLQICSREWMTDLFEQGSNLKVSVCNQNLHSRYSPLDRNMMWFQICHLHLKLFKGTRSSRYLQGLRRQDDVGGQQLSRCILHVWGIRVIVRSSQANLMHSPMNLGRYLMFIRHYNNRNLRMHTVTGYSMRLELQPCFDICNQFNSFSNTLKKWGFALTDLTVTQLVDCLAVMSHARASSSDAISGNFTLKALRWFRKIAGVSCLEIVFSPLADSFLKVRLTTDTKEAPPLPLWILFHWEKRILFSQSTTFEIIMLGAFLFMTWSSLRFSGVQRMNIESLVLSDMELRGMVWRSKTRSNGHPFGITSSGLCSTGSFTWVVKFLRTWDALLAESGCGTWDFLIPHLSEQGTLLSHEPLDYASALRIFRDMLYTPWKRFSGPHPLDQMQLNYTLHSAKATLLSFGPQLGSAVESDDRLQQGHHADPRKSLHLYGRDSVWGALRYQQIVIQQIRKGFRPKTAQHRGGQTPLVEPQVTLECFKKQAVEYVYRYLPFSAPNLTIEVDEAPLTEDICSTSASDSDGSSQPNLETDIQEKSAKIFQTHDESEFDEIIFAKHRRVTHAMVVVSSEDLDRPCYLVEYWRPACGTHMSHEDTKFLSEWDSTLSFCQHPGCKKAWAAAGMFWSCPRSAKKGCPYLSALHCIMDRLQKKTNTFFFMRRIYCRLTYPRVCVTEGNISFHDWQARLGCVIWHWFWSFYLPCIHMLKKKRAKRKEGNIHKSALQVRWCQINLIQVPHR